MKTLKALLIAGMLLPAMAWAQYKGGVGRGETSRGINPPVLSHINFWTAAPSVCPGNTMNMAFLFTGTYNSGNTFRVEMSDANGSFTSPTILFTTGVVTIPTTLYPAVTFPGNLASSTGYLLRVRSTGPLVISNLVAMVVGGPQDPGIDAVVSICSDQSTELFLALGGDPQQGGTWSGPSPIIGAQYIGLTMSPGVYTYTVNDLPGCTGSNSATVTVTEVAQPTAGPDVTLPVCVNSGPVSLFAALTGAQPGGSWNGPSPVVDGMYDPASMIPGNYIYTVNAQAPCAGSDAATVSATEVDPPDAGMNGAITICSNGSTNLFDALGGTPDAGGTWNGPSPVINGEYDALTMEPGVYTYTASAAPCADATATVTVSETPAADAGIGTSYTVCDATGTIDLFTLLSGTPVAGGTWSGPSPIIGGIHDIATMDPGVYTYTVTGQAPCGIQASANVTINEPELADPGTNGTLNVCSDALPSSLFAALGGTPETGGNWSGPSAVFGGQYAPLTMEPGIYTYDVMDLPPCFGMHSATVIVSETAPPEAGNDNTTSVCALGVSFDLSVLLSNDAQAGGTWNGPSTIMGGIYDPLAMDPGVYTYTVNAQAPCAVPSIASFVIDEQPAPAWYADVDGDGLGDPATPQFACDQPVGFVADATDDCPLLPGAVGASCDDGNTGTENDTVSANCVCSGTPIPCAGESVTLTINADASGEEISWIIFDDLQMTVASGGPYIGQSGSIAVTECLPTTFGERFTFRLFDAGGDGIANGSWELRDVNGTLILRDDGAFGAVSPANNNGHEFSLPLGPGTIATTSCGVFNSSLFSKVFAVPVSGALMYQFEFSDPNAGFRRRIAVPRPWVKYNEMQTSPLVPGTVYLSRVRADQGANGFSDDPFGAGCELGMDPTANNPCTQLIDDADVPGFSCGATKTFGGSDKIWARPVSGASQYRFRFVNTTLGYSRNVTRASYVCPLNWVTQPLIPGYSYQVTVEANVNNTWSGFCGNECPLTIAQAPSMPQQRDPEDGFVGSFEPELRLWPNPNNGERINLSLKGAEEGTQPAVVELIDPHGAIVLRTTLQVVDGSLDHVLSVPANTAPGNYLLRLVTADRPMHKRLTIAR